MEKVKDVQAIKDLINQQGTTVSALARVIGITPVALWDRLNNPKRKSMKVEVFEETLRGLGYELVAQPSGSRLVTGAVRIK